MITTHQYIHKYPIIPSSEILICGTIHPHDFEKFIVQFFYGNKLSLWKILNEAFNFEMGKEIDLDGILKFLKARKISVSDTILECKRIKPSSLDKDLKPLKLNHAIKEQIRNSEIKWIYFTSGFQKNNAFKLFYEDILGLTLTAEILKNREIILNKNVFGRPVKLIALYSPSGSANVGLSRSKIYLDNKNKYAHFKTPVQRFKVDYYREYFSSALN